MPADFPNARFGAADTPLPNWRRIEIKDDADDDELLASTPADVVEMLGFDPAKERDKD